MLQGLDFPDDPGEGQGQGSQTECPFGEVGNFEKVLVKFEEMVRSKMDDIPFPGKRPGIHLAGLALIMKNDPAIEGRGHPK